MIWGRGAGRSIIRDIYWAESQGFKAVVTWLAMHPCQYDLGR